MTRKWFAAVEKKEECRKSVDLPQWRPDGEAGGQNASLHCSLSFSYQSKWNVDHICA